MRADLISKPVRTSLFSAVAATIAILAQVAPANALDISRHPSDSPTVNAISLRGTIVPGDPEALAAYIGALPKKERIVVYLESPGGVLQAGLKLGKYFYANGIHTVVASPRGCHSACSLAFLGGRDARAEAPQRVKYSGAKLGYHSFSTRFEQTTFTAEDMAKVVQQTQDVVFEITQYLKDIDTDLEVLRYMLAAAADEMRLLSNDEAARLGILIFDEKSNKVLAKPARVAGLGLCTPTPTAQAPLLPATAKHRRASGNLVGDGGAAVH